MPSLLLQSLFPLVFIMLLGWLSGKLGYTRREDASVLATVVIRFALPFHLFIGALNTHPDKIKNFTFMAVLVIGLMGSYFLTLLISRYVFRHDIKTSAIQSLVCAFPDMAYFGAPVLAVLIGPEGFLGVLIGNLVTSVLMIPLTIILIRMGDKHRSADEPQLHAGQLILQNLLKAVRNPIVWIPISGVLLSLAGVQLPPMLSMPIEMVGKIAGGLSLFALGLLFYGEAPDGQYSNLYQYQYQKSDPTGNDGPGRTGLWAQSYLNATGYYHRRDAFRHRGRDVCAAQRYLY